MTQISYPTNNFTFTKLSKYDSSFNLDLSDDEESMEQMFLENELSIEEEIALYAAKPLFGEKIHNELNNIWNNLRNWTKHFANKPLGLEFADKVFHIIQEIKSHNVKTSKYFFGFELDPIIENALQSNYKFNGYDYGEQIYDLSFAFNLYFQLCLLDEPKYLNKYFDYINRIIIQVLRCKKGSRYLSIVNEWDVNKINNKIKKYKLKRKIINWFGFSNKKN